jgi:hypothetical protein
VSTKRISIYNSGSGPTYAYWMETQRDVEVPPRFEPEVGDVDIVYIADALASVDILGEQCAAGRISFAQFSVYSARHAEDVDEYESVLPALLNHADEAYINSNLPPAKRAGATGWTGPTIECLASERGCSVAWRRMIAKKLGVDLFSFEEEPHDAAVRLAIRRDLNFDVRGNSDFECRAWVRRVETGWSRHKARTAFLTMFDEYRSKRRLWQTSNNNSTRNIEVR